MGYALCITHIAFNRGSQIMKFRFLGTAAAEGFPAVFCNCKYCMEARKRKGKNIRTRSQAIVNDDMLLDFPADTYMHALDNDLELSKIKYLLITHKHQDHFYPEELNMRGHWFAPEMKDKLTMICSEQVNALFEKNCTEEMRDTVKSLIDIKVLKPFDKVDLGDYQVTALPARHGFCDGFIYHIKQGDKNILYAHDTGYFFDSVLEYIKNSNITFDFITFDCCNIDLVVGEDSTHMCLDNIAKLVSIMKSCGAVNDNTILYANHFSHNVNPIHDELCEKAEKYGLQVSYDGLEIDV